MWTLSGAPVSGGFEIADVQYPANVLDIWPTEDLEAIGLVWVEPAAPSLADLKAARLEELAARRRQATSVVSVGGLTIPWNDTTENRVANAVKALEMKPEGATVSWEVTRGVFAALDLPTLMAIALAAFDVQQGAFANVRDLTTLILGAEDEAALAAIDIETGWP